MQLMAGVAGRSGGWNRKPTSLKVLQGTFRADRANPLEPRLAAGRPPRPAWLSESARGHWRRLVEETEALGVLTPVDGIALAMLAQTLDAYVQFHDDWRARNAFSKLTLTLLREFGLTPASRGRVNVAARPAEEPNEFEELFRNTARLEEAFKS
jgi:phage terminase small subunit